MDSPTKDCPKCACGTSSNPAQILGRSLSPVSPKHGGSIPPAWTYEKIDDWPDICKTGNFQSPIDLKTKSTKWVSEFIPISFSEYNVELEGNLCNTGRTINFSLDSTRAKPKLSGGELDGEYVLDSFHFHWPSEHAFDGKRFDLESHLVHYSTKFDSLASAVENDGVAVLGTLFKIFHNVPKVANQTIRTINVNLGQIATDLGKNVRIQIPNLLNFIPPNSNEFFRYWGSLTTPGCNEKVLWTVFAQKIPIYVDDYNALIKVYNEKREPIVANSRPLQKENNREVKYYVMPGDPEETNPDK